ncbi:MAG: hypothetical protein LBD73_07390 [Deferribacteraceae bacterium]|jgi:hypothetical protein|nr:hypothetical protein [Deferribacteraceae bacterium]
MKRFFISIFTMSLIIISVSAFAWGHWGRDGGHGGCPGPNGTYKGGEGGIGADVNAFTAEDAKAVLENTLIPNYIGYTFGEIESFATPKGFNVYLVRAEDAAGNKFVFFFGQRGHIKGPVLESDLPQRY